MAGAAGHAGIYGAGLLHECRRSGYITTAEAREIMREVGATEPDERGATIRAFSPPVVCRREKGSEHWPINTGRLSAEDAAWGMIFGIQDGWFRYDRSGHLQCPSLAASGTRQARA